MVQVIARMFGSHDTALAAQKALQQRGLPANEIHVVPGSASQAPAPQTEPADSETQAVTEDWAPTEQAPQAAAPASDEVMARLARLGLPADEAAVYARELSQGHSLVTVRPPFGSAQLAINTLHEFDPIPLEVHEPRRAAPPPESARAAPFSARFGWPVLLNDPEPLSRALGWRTLKPDPETSKTSEQVHKLSSEAAPLSDRIKLPVLSGNAAPLSSAIKAPTLSGDPAPLSHAVRMKVLLDEPAPLSKKAGWGVLLDDPAPLSRTAGWRVLLSDPAPLSRLLGLPVLLKK